MRGSSHTLNSIKSVDIAHEMAWHKNMVQCLTYEVFLNPYLWDFSDVLYYQIMYCKTSALLRKMTEHIPPWPRRDKKIVSFFVLFFARRQMWAVPWASRAFERAD